MIIPYYNYLGANMSYTTTLADIEKIDAVIISNAKYDVLKITSDTTDETPFECGSNWDSNMILYAPFTSNLSGGNIGFLIDNTSDILIKRRKKGTFKWITIFNRKINSASDYDITYNDYFVPGDGVYEYAIVNVLNDVEKGYIIIEVDTNFNGVYIADKNKIYGTIYDISTFNITRTFYNAKKEPLKNKYPTSSSFSKQNYDSGSVSGFFTELNCGDIIKEYSNEYREEIIDFLSDGNPKIIKDFDGQVRLVNIDGEINCEEDGHYLHKIISFDWYQTGNHNSEKDLYDANLSDVPSQFWSNIYE